MIKAILFDLDGTLLPMQQDEFTTAYFEGLSKKLAPYGYEPQRLIGGVWQGTKAMVKNDGKQTNEQLFWKEFAELFGDKVYDDIDKFNGADIEEKRIYSRTCVQPRISHACTKKAYAMGRRKSRRFCSYYVL